MRGDASLEHRPGAYRFDQGVGVHSGRAHGAEGWFEFYDVFAAVFAAVFLLRSIFIIFWGSYFRIWQSPLGED